MTWQPDQWEAFCGLLEEAWPGAFDDDQARSWRILIDPVDPPVAIETLRRLLYEGHTFRPSVSEFLAHTRRDPGRPTFDEAYQLIFGSRGLLRRLSALEQGDQGRRAHVEGQFHPLVVAFVHRQGEARLRTLPVEDPDWGEKHRRDLGAAWDRHVEACDGRDVAQLAAPRRGELQHFDPLAALEPQAPALTAGGDA